MICLCLCAVSCNQKNNTAEDILGGIMKEMENLPKGRIYHAQAEEGDSGYMSAELLQSLYGERGSDLKSKTSDYAIYLSSFASPCEVGVFIC